MSIWPQELNESDVGSYSFVFTEYNADYLNTDHVLYLNLEVVVCRVDLALPDIESNYNFYIGKDDLVVTFPTSNGNCFFESYLNFEYPEEGPRGLVPED